MHIADYLKEERILLCMKATNKKEAIDEVLFSLRGAREIVDFDVFCHDVFKRETLSATAIGGNIAIPHARTDATKEFVIAFGRSVTGIDFGALDNQPVKLIFLMATPKEEGLNDYLKILSHLTRLLQKEDFRNALLKASTASDVVEEFRKLEH